MEGMTRNPRTFRKFCLATTTFLGVRDAIMAEYEHTMCPSTLAVHKISAVKHKGKSPPYLHTLSRHLLSQLLLKLLVMRHQALPIVRTLGNCTNFHSQQMSSSCSELWYLLMF